MYLEKDNDTDRLKKSVYIYTFVFTGTYTGPFCHNPVESRLILLDSSSIPLDSSGMDAFLQESVGHQKVQQRPFIWSISLRTHTATLISLFTNPTHSCATPMLMLYPTLSSLSICELPLLQPTSAPLQVPQVHEGIPLRTDPHTVSIINNYLYSVHSFFYLLTH